MLSASNYDATRRRVGDRSAAAAGAVSAEAVKAETHNNEVIKVTEESPTIPLGRSYVKLTTTTASSRRSGGEVATARACQIRCVNNYTAISWLREPDIFLYP